MKKLAIREVTSIPGLLLVDIPVHSDNRGFFKENFQKEKMIEAGFPEAFFESGKLQHNVSFSKYNTIRGLHAEPWDKYVSVADNGHGIGVWVDLREGETFGNTYQHILTADVGVFIPKGVANGFQVLSPSGMAYTYLVNDYWSQEGKDREYAFVNYLDPELHVAWVNPLCAEVSEDDKNHPLLRDVKPFKL